MSNGALRGARSVADVGGGVVLASVEIAAPVERVFRALSSDDIVRWWGSPELYRTTEWHADLRPGGRWQARGVSSDGKAFGVQGEFLEIEPPYQLVQTWKPDWVQGPATKITYRLEPIDGGTRVTVRHEGFGEQTDSCRSHGRGWERVLGWLAGFFPAAVAAASAPEARYFFCRLLPPRSTFMVDMTPEEREIMQRHAGYWRGLLEQGVAVVFGPVADPNGGWGLGVIRTSGEDAMNALRDADPVILSGRGFRYEVFPMVRAVARD